MEQKITWTAAELKEFDNLCDDVCSTNQMTRLNGRFSMDAFIKLHSKEKCDAMWAHLEGTEK